MSSDFLIILFALCIAVLLFIVVAFMLLQQKKGKTNQGKLKRSLDKTNSQNSKLGKSAKYQKLYLTLAGTPIVNRYLFKTRMRYEMVGDDNEYFVRAQAAQTTMRSILIAIGLALVLMWINRDSTFLMLVSCIGVLVVVESITERKVNRIEDKLLNQQLEFFSEVRHAYHETNMVEEAIYDASLIEENEVSFQADKIYDALIAPDSETELEKYYDVAPNRFLKVFAGICYLTREFGDRKVNDTSLFLKNMNNITQEMQLEILKRSKIDYLFQSLSWICLAPILCINLCKDWAESNFSSTMSFYEGKYGFAMQIFLLVLIFGCYSMIKRVKDSNNTSKYQIVKDKPWEDKLYHIPVFEKFVDNVMPASGKKEYVKIRRLLKDAASKKRMEWFYVDRIVYAFLGFFGAIILFNILHSIAIQSVLENVTMEDGQLGSLSDSEMEAGMSKTAYDASSINEIEKMDLVQGSDGTYTADSSAPGKRVSIVEIVKTQPEDVAKGAIESALREISDHMLTDSQMDEDAEKIYKQYLADNRSEYYEKARFEQSVFNAGVTMTRSDYVSMLLTNVTSNVYDHSNSDEDYNPNDDNKLLLTDIRKGLEDMNSEPLTDEQVTENAERIYTKLKTLTNENLQVAEVIVSFLFAFFMYYVPVFMLRFQVFMRRMDMEDEVMQYQTVILMLMHIERVSVEYILEWLERFAVIFKEPISTCLNNFDAGGYEALEQLKDDAPYKPLIRIVESLQSAVENVKISNAFDELETDRSFFQEKRKEANERLIAKKQKIGKLLGFAPMVTLFVGYLIGPLVIVSMGNMGTYFTQLGSMM